MKVYHGHASPADLESCRQATDTVTHGIEWSDARRMPIRDEPYILDNGAYAAATNGEPWDKQQWYNLLTKAHDQPRDPDFVVLPDVYGDVERTQTRHKRFVEIVRSHGYEYYAVAQPGSEPAQQVEFTESINASGIFMGGPEEWKRSEAVRFRDLTHQYGLQLHIGQPGNIRWAKDVGFDSCDTTSIVVNDAYDRLRELDGYEPLGSFV